MLYYLVFSLGSCLAHLTPRPTATTPLFSSASSLLILIYYGWRSKPKPSKTQLPFSNLLSQAQTNWRKSVMLSLAILTLAYNYASWRINLRTQQLIQLPIYHLLITGYLTSPPQLKNDYIQAEFTLKNSLLPTAKLLLHYSPGFKLKAGHRYQLLVNIRPLDLPPKFTILDYQQYLFSQNIGGFATLQQLVQDYGLDYALPSQINRLRLNLIDYLNSILKQAKYSGLIIALVTGWQSQIPDEQWNIFKASGILHIISISGLHITLIAVWIGIFTKLGLRLAPALIIPEQIIITWSGAAAAVAYTIVAGFNLPAQRAMFMLLLAAYLTTCRRHIPLLHKLGLILGLILLIDPFAIASIGFWYSFSLVAIIFISAQLYAASDTKLRRWLKLQLAILLLSAIISLFIFANFPLVSIIANLWAVPIIGDIFTPLILAATILHADSLLQILARLLEQAMLPIEYLAKVPIYWQAEPSIAALGLSLFGLSLIIVPYPFRAKNWLGGILFAAILLPTPRSEINYQDVEIKIFREGQIASGLIRTKQHQLLVSIGSNQAAYIKHLKYNLLPYLSATQIKQIDYLITNFSAESIIAYLKTEQISVNQQPLPTQLAIDGVLFKNLSQQRHISILIKTPNSSQYIGSGFYPFSQTSLDNIIILLPLSELYWLYQMQATNLILNYPAHLTTQIQNLLDNLFMPNMQIYDLTHSKSILIHSNKLESQ